VTSGTASSVRYTSRIQGEFHDYLRRIRASNFGGFQTMHSQGWMKARVCGACWCVACSVIGQFITFPTWVSVTLHILRIGQVSVVTHPHATIAEALTTVEPQHRWVYP